MFSIETMKQIKSHHSIDGSDERGPTTTTRRLPALITNPLIYKLWGIDGLAAGRRGDFFIFLGVYLTIYLHLVDDLELPYSPSFSSFCISFVFSPVFMILYHHV